MGRALVGCCVAAPAAQSAEEEISAAPPAPPAAPGVVGQAGGGRPAGVVRAALAACGAKALQWQRRLLQLRQLAPASVPMEAAETPAAGKKQPAASAEVDAGKAPPPPRAPSAEQGWDELVASSLSASSGVRTLAFTAFARQGLPIAALWCYRCLNWPPRFRSACTELLAN
jgi:hypothetical protein